MWYINNGDNATPAIDLCSMSSNYVQAGVTDQQGLAPGSEYTLHFYTRDADAGLGSNGFYAPAGP